MFVTAFPGTLTVDMLVSEPNEGVSLYKLKFLLSSMLTEPKKHKI